MKPTGKLLTWLVLLVATALILTAPPATASDASPRLSSDTLHGLLEQALEAFSDNDFETAADLFQRLEQDFGNEADYQDPAFLRRLLPLKGYAELASGLPSAAAKTLTRFVDEFPNDPQRASAMASLASALQRDGQLQEAVERLTEFEEKYSHRPEAALALLQRTKILFLQGNADEALKLLETFSTGSAPAVFRHQARLRAARQMIEAEDLPTAVRLLLDHSWEIDSMPEVAVLSFAALELGDLLMAAANFTDALRAYRLVLPRERLLALQEKRLEEIRANLDRAAGATSGRFWHDYYRRLFESMSRQVASLNESDDYTPSLLLRRGQAMLLVDRPHEAWLLFERLALDESLPTTIREEAHYRWVVAANDLELWEEALTIARTFLSMYPEASLAAQTIYLIAQAHQEQRRYAEAEEILAELQTRFPDHALAQRWRFTRGFNRVRLEDFPGARLQFRRAVEDFPDGHLNANAELWHALTFFFEREYDTALGELDDLAKRYENHPLTGEILYRRASTLYAMREYERAEKETADFVERFKRHQRYREALVLLGDIRMGTGELKRARNTFEQIAPEAGHLFLYGLFQQGKILRALQEYDEMIRLFSHYVERADIEEKGRLSEALYWIGWAHTQLDEEDKAVPLFLTALERHGNDPSSGEIGSILDLLEDLGEMPLNGGPRSFSDWIVNEREAALDEDRLCYFSRLTLHLVRGKQKEDLPHQADELLFEIASEAPVNRLGPAALGRVGHLLAEKKLERAEVYFEALLKSFPDAPERAFAYHGFAERRYDRGDYEDALTWLRRFENETPTHSLASDVMLMAGESLRHLGRFDEAADKFEEILSLRSMRGRAHAAALVSLAETMVATSQTEKAVAYYQRVYTLHRAQTDLTAKAYFESSRLFEELGDKGAAHRTLTEMLSLEELEEYSVFEQAREREAILAPEVAELTAEKEASDVE